MHGYWGRILHIDLTARRTRVVERDAAYLRAVLGGAGLAAQLLHDYCPPGADPLGPDNPLVLASSAFAGTMVPTSAKHALAARSPLTGLIGDSLSSSFFSVALKRTGYDAIVITGQAPSLTYLLIDDDRVYFRDAVWLAGKSAGETEELVRRRTGDSRVRVATTGPAGESMVRYACVSNDGGRQAGRTGLGAVMGAKRLKAIAVRGTKAVSVADMQALERTCSDLYRRSQEAGTEKYRVLGTPGNVLGLNRLASLPTRNAQQATFGGAEAVSGEALAEQHLERVVACAACPIACEHVCVVHDGPYAGARVRIDYETLYALGPMCAVDSLEGIIKCAELCNQLGLDTISAGVTIAWAMESFERGLLTEKDCDGLSLTFGNHEAMVQLLPRIARREGIGNLLAEGTREASRLLGGGSSHWAMHSKGLELPGYDPRSMKTLALGYAVGTRGGCHNRSAAYEVDMSGRVDRFKGERGRGAAAAQTEDFAAVLDSLVLCKFIRRCFSEFYTEVAGLYNQVTGLDLSAEALRLAGERVTNVKKLFNIAQGWCRADDWLPPRVFLDPIPDGAAAGAVLTPAELQLMIDDYYEARGWTAEGLVPSHTLRRLGLESLAREDAGRGAALHRV